MCRLISSSAVFGDSFGNWERSSGATAEAFFLGAGSFFFFDVEAALFESLERGALFLAATVHVYQIWTGGVGPFGVPRAVLYPG